jgi:hypothetical protein
MAERKAINLKTSYQNYLNQSTERERARQSESVDIAKRAQLSPVGALEEVVDG